MKNIFLLVISITCAFYFSCSEDESAISADMSFICRDAETPAEYAPSRAVNDASGDIDRVYFRSSDIEFWSVSSTAGIDNCISEKYADGNLPAGANVSVIVDLLDVDETFVFEPGYPSYFDAQNNPEFEYKEYNLARLDVGGGTITFIINGSEEEVLFYDESANYLDCNSIFFIDSAYLSNDVYISRPEARAIESGSSSGNAAIDSILRNSNYADNDGTAIDVDGALFIPFNPVDFGGYNEISEIIVDVTWDMDNLLLLDDNDNGDPSDDFYKMTDRVEGTCFDFNIEIIVVEQ